MEDASIRESKDILYGGLRLAGFSFTNGKKKEKIRKKKLYNYT